MSVRNAIVALLTGGPMGAYQLRKDFESRTGGTWPINIGQVYSTLQRLERDGLIASLGVQPDGVEPFTLTLAGQAEAATWWATPVAREQPERNELVIKLALAATLPGVDVRDVVQRQRSESMRALRAFTRLKTDEADDLVWRLVLENQIFATEAEIRWLDHIEQAVARAAKSGPATGRADGATPSADAARTSDDAPLATVGESTRTTPTAER